MKRVLLVEDDPLVVAVLLGILDEHELEVVEVENGLQALVMIASRQFDVVVSDFTMSGVDGLEVLERAKEENPSARLVLISGYADERVEGRAKDLGALLLHKPFGAEAFRNAVGVSR